MVSLTDLRIRAARARIGCAASLPAAPAELGGIRLRADQRLAVARVAHALARDGGCLLADDVGRGKTYVALAAARQWRHPLVVIPASLRRTWLDAMRRTGVHCSLVTHEALSRGSLPLAFADGIIVDESHRFRSPAAKRYGALARLSAHAQLLLLSATPLQNGARDLAAQLALFLGSAAFRRPASDLARHVIRGGRLTAGELPEVAPPRWVQLAVDEGAVLQAIVALPAPAAPLDAGDAGALRTISLVRAWASSRAALLATLRRRRRVATAIEQCAASGLAPSRRDVRSWQGVGDDVQLALAPLLVNHSLHTRGPDVGSALAAERDALGELERALAGAADPDPARVAALRRLRADHAGQRILAFSEFASTVRAYFGAMRADPEVGLLTASGARIASGPVTRDALLARFAPLAQGAPPPRRAERVTLLVSTDLLSEGVNLQDASVVVHLDLPWNPARLAQRVGRARRAGGAAVVHSYLFAPPARTEVLLAVESRLREKLRRAELAIGRALPVMPTLAGPPLPNAAEPPPAQDASAAALGALADRLTRWRRPCGRVPATATLVAATGDGSGWLAALDDGRLLADDGTGPTDDGAVVMRAAAWAEGAGRPATDAELSCALASAARWIAREEISAACGMTAERPALEIAIERRIARALRRAPRHERAAAHSLASRLRAALEGERSLGAEWELADSLERTPDRAALDPEWLERTLAIAAKSPRPARPRGTPRVVALVVLGDPTRPL